ncbi:hypothetical protein DFA_10348 [Cavenderia fasciculata]|uniref:Uncharacterized protein n=1 Tax=Cavenderia fasciculata TaxID=261658 RepID=F4Q9Y8_CACFS|nr:uncharacterized protein DFA_10348 [Cavenderia fasciculata]EGG15507.1 hypothetical protein DFA_10348 [Cavenderia fasciculata]|eukprot:XP_004354249.1 hypothetical protein DFA_10348 [Cavenderia fasciculata]
MKEKKNSLQMIFNHSYLRRLIFNHVSSIHKQLEITTVKVSSLYTLIDYIRYGLNDIFFKHIDQLWSLMFESSDGIYRNNDKIIRIISSTIYYSNDRVLEYLLNRIKKEIGPFQTMVTVNFKESKEDEEKRSRWDWFGYVECLPKGIFDLLVDDNVFIESKVLLHRMVQTAIMVVGDVNIIQNLFKRYHLLNIQSLFLQQQEKDNQQQSLLDKMFDEKNDLELIEICQLVKRLNLKVDGVESVILQALKQDRYKVIQFMDRFCKYSYREVLVENAAIRENARKSEIYTRHSNGQSYQLMDKIKKNGTDLDFIQYVYQRKNNHNDYLIFQLERWVISKALVNGEEDVIKFALNNNQRKKNDIFDQILDLYIHPVFCSRHYIDIFSNLKVASPQIIRSTLLHAPKGRKLDELEYLLTTQMANKLFIDLADSIAAIIELGDDMTSHMISRFEDYVFQNPIVFQTRMDSIKKYTCQEYPQRQRFILELERILKTPHLPNIGDEDFGDWILPPSLVLCLSRMAQYQTQTYFFLCSAAMSNNFVLYKQAYDILSMVYLNPNDQLIEILAMIINACHYEFAKEFLNFHSLLLEETSINQFKNSINTFFKLYFKIKKEKEDYRYQQLADDILKVVPEYIRSEIIYYATELKDDQFNSIWIQYSNDLDLNEWLSNPSKHYKQLKYDQNFFNHLQRIYRYFRQDQLDKYQSIINRLNAPPLHLEYIGILNQCLDKYYFNSTNNNNFNKDNNNNNSIVNNYTLKEYNHFIDKALEIGFIPIHFKK